MSQVIMFFLGADDHLISYSVIEQVCNKILLYNEEKSFLWRCL